MRHIAFRVDASVQMGTGHLMRCLTLADWLKPWANIIFVARELEGNLNWLIEKRGYQLHVLPQSSAQETLEGYEKWLSVRLPVDAEQTKTVLEKYKIDCLIIDHYALDQEWEKKLRPLTKKIMVIDDLANRVHDCDLLLDQNYRAEIGNKYKGLIPDGCHCFFGLQYLLLREEFFREKNKLRKRDGKVKRILIFFGGSDPTNETLKALDAVQVMHRKDLFVDVVVGAANPMKRKIEERCRIMENIKFYCQIENIAELMAKADLSIGAAGGTAWERCFLGLPSLVMSVAENQGREKPFEEDFEPYVFLGWHECVTKEVLIQTIIKTTADVTSLRFISEAAERLFQGVHKRNELICAILEEGGALGV